LCWIHAKQLGEPELPRIGAASVNTVNTVNTVNATDVVEKLLNATVQGSVDWLSLFAKSTPWPTICKRPANPC
jgi:hypothetical protein